MTEAEEIKMLRATCKQLSDKIDEAREAFALHASILGLDPMKDATQEDLCRRVVNERDDLKRALEHIASLPATVIVLDTGSYGRGQKEAYAACARIARDFIKP